MPILISREGYIIDGYARYELARRGHRTTILCLIYDLSEDESLQWLIQLHLPSKGFNSYCRTQLVSDLEPALREPARINQQIGGQFKGESNLTEAERKEVRSQSAAIAMVSTGHFSKARRVATSAIPAVQQAVKAGEVSVHKAFGWTRLAANEQNRKLQEDRASKGTTALSRKLISKHVATSAPMELIPKSLTALMREVASDRPGLLDHIAVAEIDAPGQIAYFTKDAMRTLRSAKDPKCRTGTS